MRQFSRQKGSLKGKRKAFNLSVDCSFVFLDIAAAHTLHSTSEHSNSLCLIAPAGVKLVCLDRWAWRRQANTEAVAHTKTCNPVHQSWLRGGTIRRKLSLAFQAQFNPSFPIAISPAVEKSQVASSVRVPGEEASEKRLGCKLSSAGWQEQTEVPSWKTA